MGANRSVVAALAALLYLASSASVPAKAQESPALPGKTFMRKNIFYLPIRIDDRIRNNLREVRLYSKGDVSKPWQLRDTVPPGQSFFSFRADRDGEYWFTVVTVDRQGLTTPADVQQEGPGLIVVLDTTPPSVQLQPLEKTDAGQIVHCAIRDDNPAPEKSKFFYQTGDQIWRPLEPLPEDPQKFCIPAQAVLTGMVRVSAADLADNTVTNEINLTTIPMATAEPKAIIVGDTAPRPVLEPREGQGVAVPTPPTATQPPTSVRYEEPIFTAPETPRRPIDAVAPRPGNGIPQPPVSIFDPAPPAPLFVQPPTSRSNPVAPVQTPASPPLPMPPAEGDTFQLQQISKKALGEQTPPPLPLPSPAPFAQIESNNRDLQPQQPIQDPFVRPTANQQATVPQLHSAAASHGTPAPQADFVPNKQLVNKRLMYLQYQIEQTGASGVGRVEIWLTRDRGQTWEKFGEDADRTSPAEITLPGEGLFGISLVVSNGRGFGAAPPSAGDPADWWVEVDITRPYAELLSVLPGMDEHAGSTIISWTARDRNLAPNSIALSWAPGPDGPWRPIAKGLENQSQYRWNVPGEIGPQVFVRLEAHDAAGNVTETRTAQPVALDDLSRPRARIRAISTAGTINPNGQ